MKVAEDSTGRRIDADRAWHGGRYYCPRCHAPVHLRCGNTREAHFAHDSGKAATNCDLYFQGKYTPSHSRPTERQPAHLTLNLYITCDDRSGVEGGWKLYLMIPGTDTGSGTVTVQGYWGAVTYRFEELHQGRRVQVRPQSRPYELTVQGFGDPAYISRLGTPTPGLGKHACTVFRFSPSGGRRLSDRQALYWGRAYVLVWSTTHGPDWWPKSVKRWEMRPEGEWHCAVIELPADPDPQATSWAERCLKRHVKQPPANLVLTWPVPSAWLDDETLVVPFGSHVVVGVFGEQGATSPSALCVDSPSLQSIRPVPLSGTLPELVSLGQLPIGRTDVWLPEDPDLGLSLLVMKDADFPATLPNVTLDFENPLDGHRSTLSLLSDSVGESLKSVVNGSLKLIRINLPPRVQGVIRYRSGESRSWSEVRTDPESSTSGERGLELAGQLNRVLEKYLQRSGGELELDYGNFGRLVIDLTRARPTAATTELPSSLRPLLHWLLKLPLAPNLAYQSEGVLLLTNVLVRLLPELDPNDRWFVQNLLSRRTWPTAAEAHMRRLALALLRKTRRQGSV